MNRSLLKYIRSYIGFTILSIIMFYALWLLLDENFRVWFLAGNYVFMDYLKDVFICMLFTLLTQVTSAGLYYLFRAKMVSYAMIVTHSMLLFASNLLVSYMMSLLAERLWNDYDKAVAMDMLVFCLISLTQNSLFYNSRFWNSISKEQQRRHELEMRMLQLADQEKQTQLLVLKKQLDPHFLFNNLSVLTSLVEDNSPQAPEFLNALAKMYRYLTINSNENMSTIADELKLLGWYQYLLSVRFRDGLCVNISDEVKTCKGKVPSLGLMTLVANVFKHSERKPHLPIVAKVYLEGDYLVVENEYRPLEKPIKSTGVGLQNLSDRCLLLQNRTLEVIKTDEKFIVKLPISK